MKRKILLLLLVTLMTVNPVGAKIVQYKTFTISKSKLLDKIKGGWAGQTIGCTYGGPVEFKYLGKIIPDTVVLKWDNGCIKKNFEDNGGLYDDVYMDLTFVDVFNRLGLDASVDSFAQAFAHAPYPLWHANQAARYNILRGIMPPESGFWKNNPHADCIDFQIEADFAGLMSPGIPNAATYFSDKIGHIMNYGDGWYGGVYIAAMYSLAFKENNIENIVTKALKILPPQSKYYKCISDIIRWHKQYPKDWKKTWKLCQDRYSDDLGCPECVYRAEDIDAVLNGAYVVIGLLYGQGDFSKTLEISARCGQDADCNPASAAGVLGTMLGYSQIPGKWMKNLKEVEDMPFAYTSISLNKAYEMSFNQAIQVVKRFGGIIKGEKVLIKEETPNVVRYEKSFEGLYLAHMKGLKTYYMKKDYTVSFDGVGFAIVGGVYGPKNYVADLEIFVDGKSVTIMHLPANIHDRSDELCWNYNITKGNHQLTLHWLNPKDDVSLAVRRVIFYSNKPAKK